MNKESIVTMEDRSSVRIYGSLYALIQERAKEQKITVTEAANQVVEAGLSVRPKDADELVMDGLELCPKCREDLRKFSSGMRRSVGSVVREILWKWWGTWPHGLGCPGGKEQGWKGIQGL